LRGASCSSLSSFATHPPSPAIYPLSLHDALPIFLLRHRSPARGQDRRGLGTLGAPLDARRLGLPDGRHRPRQLVGLLRARLGRRSEEHTSELQSRENLVCRLLLDKKNNTHIHTSY